jgi:hypothetical protein
MNPKNTTGTYTRTIIYHWQTTDCPMEVSSMENAYKETLTESNQKGANANSLITFVVNFHRK